MATKENTSTELDRFDTRRHSALRCFEWMREMDRIIPMSAPDDPRGFLMFPHDKAETIIKELGPMSPETEGLLMPFIEHFVYSIISGGEPNMDPGYWRPVATMTLDELAEEIAEAEDEAQERERAEKSNVVELRRYEARPQAKATASEPA